MHVSYSLLTYSLVDIKPLKSQQKSSSDIIAKKHPKNLKKVTKTSKKMTIISKRSNKNFGKSDKKYVGQNVS